MKTMNDVDKELHEVGCKHCGAKDCDYTLYTPNDWHVTCTDCWHLEPKNQVVYFKWRYDKKWKYDEKSNTTF